MKLDRNKNHDGSGKYALIKIRKLNQLRNQSGQLPDDIQCAIGALEHAGLVCYGNESPGDQFFVVKYKDKFTASALQAYAIAVRGQANGLGQHETKKDQAKELHEYADEMFIQAAEAHRHGTRIPD